MDVDNSLVARLLCRRWQEACIALPALNQVSVSWEVGESAHFSSPRGFATMKTDGAYFWLTFSVKLCSQPPGRVDAIIRHEIGHIVDFARIPLPPGLPTTPERRADAIAELIWEESISYDGDEVQTLGPGTRPRPEKLGL
jgi:hypothetical protein